MSNFVETTRDIISTNTRYGMRSWGPRGLPEFPLDSVPPDATIMSYSPESVEKLASFQSFSILRTAALGITKVVAKAPLPPQTIGGRPVSRFGRRSGNKAERSSRRYHPAGTHPCGSMKRDVIRSLLQQHVIDKDVFTWLCQTRFYLTGAYRIRFTNKAADVTFHGCLGQACTDPPYRSLTLTQALHNQLGGAPFGPAGTGKAESVKALGVEMGRFLAVS
ncbi:hypothetical protein C8R42DRAFT_723350 [Lentinula raphanica]|nr:hypothetical protein C8R42DRAFT_723350 [Lentinula raphanica]